MALPTIRSLTTAAIDIEFSTAVDFGGVVVVAVTGKSAKDSHIYPAIKML